MNGIVAKSMMWNLWHGCHKLSAGCKHCYVYRGDARREVEEDVILETTLNMLDTMENGDIFFKKIDVSRVIIKAYIYDTLIVKGTPKQMTKAIESGDLQKVVNNLLKNDTTRGTISLGNQNYMSFSPEF